jgi:hypothetical protein
MPAVIKQTSAQLLTRQLIVAPAAVLLQDSLSAAAADQLVAQLHVPCPSCTPSQCGSGTPRTHTLTAAATLAAHPAHVLLLLGPPWPLGEAAEMPCAPAQSAYPLLFQLPSAVAHTLPNAVACAAAHLASCTQMLSLLSPDAVVSCRCQPEHLRSTN